MKDEQVPELVRMVFGAQALTVYALGGERLLAWAAAFEAWKAGIIARQKFWAWRKYHAAWAGFLGFCHKVPWEVDQRDLQGWTDKLARDGRGEATIRKYMAGLSSFYIYAEEVLDPALGVANPLEGFHRPRFNWSERFVYLSTEEAHRLLEAVDRENSLLGKRDYALLLAYLLLPGSPQDLRRLRWRDLVRNDAGACLAGDPPAPLPPEVWEAIEDYLSASGRLEGMQPEDYIFAVAADPFRRTPAGSATDWDPARPVSVSLLRYGLVRYCRAAGLREDLVSLRGLRHTAVLLRLEAGAEQEEIATFLKWREPYRVNHYLQYLAETPKPDLYSQGGERVGGGAAIQPVERGRDSFRRGHLAGFRPDLYASELPAEDYAAAREQPMDNLADEIVALRATIKGVLKHVKAAKTAEDSCRLLDMLGIAVSRLSKLMLAQKDLKGKQDPLGQMYEQALDELMQELGITR